MSTTLPSEREQLLAARAAMRLAVVALAQAAKKDVAYQRDYDHLRLELENVAAAEQDEISHIPVQSDICEAVPSQDSFDLFGYMSRLTKWSESTFGPGKRTESIIDHIRKEFVEIKADPSDAGEWIDVVAMALDGARRSGATPLEIVTGLMSKQVKNENRVWPDWRTADPCKAIEHDRSSEMCGTTIKSSRFNQDTDPLPDEDGIEADALEHFNEMEAKGYGHDLESYVAGWVDHAANVPPQYRLVGRIVSAMSAVQEPVPTESKDWADLNEWERYAQSVFNLVDYLAGEGNSPKKIAQSYFHQRSKRQIQVMLCRDRSLDFLMAPRTTEAASNVHLLPRENHNSKRDIADDCSTPESWQTITALVEAAEFCDALAKLHTGETVGFDVGYTMASKRAAQAIRNIALKFMRVATADITLAGKAGLTITETGQTELGD